MTFSSDSFFDELIEVFHSETSLQEELDAVLELIIEHTGADASGLRVRDSGDYPFLVSSGYSNSFLEQENSLVVPLDGAPLRSVGEEPVCECWCGAVLAGDVNTDLDCVTDFGSFCSNDLPEVVQSSDPGQNPARMRKTCLDAGFRSSALVPLKTEEDIIGLLQVSSGSFDTFGSEAIENLERASSLLSGRAQALYHRRKHSELDDVFNTVVPIVAIDADYRIQMANDSFVEQFSDPEYKVEGEYCYEVAPGACCQTEDCPLDRVMSGETSIECECTKEMLDGSEKTFLEQVTPRYDSGGEKSGVVIAYRDISERIQAVNELRREEKKHRLFVENLPVAVYRRSPGDAGEIKYVNSTGCEMFGYDREELLGSRVEKLYADSTQLEEFNRKISIDDSIDGIELEMERADGSLFYAQNWSRLIETNDGRWVEGIVVDVTRRKELEQRLEENERNLRRAQEVASVGSWYLDVPSGNLRWSDQTYEIFEVPGSEEVTYEKFLAYVPPEDRDKVDQQWQAALNGEDYDLEHRIVTGNGETRWVHEKAEVTFDEEGKPASGIGIVQDITERRKAQKKMEEALREKEELLEKIRQLVQNNTEVIGELIELQATEGEVNLTETSLEVYESLADLREQLNELE